MSATGNAVYIAWNDNRDDGKHLQLYYRYSLDNGQNWSNETKLSNNTPGISQICYCPTIFANGDLVIAIMKNQVDSNLTVFASSDGGNNFSPSQVINGTYLGAYPSVISDGNNVYCVYDYNALDNYYISSIDGGNTWTYPSLITTFPTKSFFAYPVFIALSQPGPVIHLVWNMMNASTNGHNAIYYTNSNISSTIDTNYLDTTQSIWGSTEISSASTSGNTQTTSGTSVTSSGASVTSSGASTSSGNTQTSTVNTQTSTVTSSGSSGSSTGSSGSSTGSSGASTGSSGASTGSSGNTQTSAGTSAGTSATSGSSATTSGNTQTTSVTSGSSATTSGNTQTSKSGTSTSSGSSGTSDTPKVLVTLFNVIILFVLF